MNNKIPLETTTFNDFVQYDILKSALDQSVHFEEIEVERPCSPVGLEEYWYLSKTGDDVWRLIRPDPPYRGSWSKRHRPR